MMDFARRKIGRLATPQMRAALYYAHKHRVTLAEEQGQVGEPTGDGQFNFNEADDSGLLAIIKEAGFY